MKVLEKRKKERKKERKEWMFDSSLDMILASQKWIFGDNAKERINRQRHVGNGTFSSIENVLLVDGSKHAFFKH